MSETALPLPVEPPKIAPTRRPPMVLLAGFAAVGLIAFLAGSLGDAPGRAWQAFLINFLLWSSIAQGAVLFSAVTRVVKARWSAPLNGLSEAFAGFFPVSLVLFACLLAGREHVFPWLHQDLHGKEIWLNLPFLFARDGAGLVLLYACGLAVLRCDLQLKAGPAAPPAAGLRRFVIGRVPETPADADRVRSRLMRWSGIYCFLYALVLSLIGFDLIMAMDPHWWSTLFGGYHFVKAFYLGLGALIVLAALRSIRNRESSGVTDRHFHDLGKLFFAFCLLWADFFYVQLNVIWYGNIPEETYYVILRTVLPPWNRLAWTVFILCFIIPFAVLINRRVKSMPRAMLALCAMITVGLWLEHLLLIGPTLDPGAAELPIGLTDGLVFLGFLGLMGLAVAFTLHQFPELAPPAGEGRIP
jgi:hypothetical protein